MEVDKERDAIRFTMAYETEPAENRVVLYAGNNSPGLALGLVEPEFHRLFRNRDRGQVEVEIPEPLEPTTLDKFRLSKAVLDSHGIVKLTLRVGDASAEILVDYRRSNLLGNLGVKSRASH